MTPVASLLSLPPDQLGAALDNMIIEDVHLLRNLIYRAASGGKYGFGPSATDYSHRIRPAADVRNLYAYECLQRPDIHRPPRNDEERRQNASMRAEWWEDYEVLMRQTHGALR